MPTEAGSPWKQILWENCCYLADDGRRAKAFAVLERKTRLDPARILAAPDSVLREVTGVGIIPERFIDKLRQCAQLALDLHGGDVDAALAGMPPESARRALRKFPGIGEPGAEKILLHAGLLATPALDSNGLRVIERLGYIKRGRQLCSAVESGTERHGVRGTSGHPRVDRALYAPPPAWANPVQTLESALRRMSAGECQGGLRLRGRPIPLTCV